MRILFFLLITKFLFGQQYKSVDFTSLKATLEPNTKSKSISGFLEYDFSVKTLLDSIKIDAQNMTVSDVLINGKSVVFKNNSKNIILFEGYKIGKNKLSFQYIAKPKQSLYFIGEKDDLQIWTQGQGKYTSHWLPSFDDVNEKVVFNLNIICELGYECISNGVLKKKYIQNSKTLHHFKMDKPMSSYLVMIAIGKFDKKIIKTKSGIPLELYIDKKDVDKWEPTYRYSARIFEFLEREIGHQYSWKIYKQVPIRDFLYAGMENTTATIFAQDFVTDSIGFNDQNYINVNAHELAHQWFGNIITAKTGKHHWLQEGFATYYALKAEQEIFGDDYFYHKLYENALSIQDASKTDTIPLLNEKASSLTFYQKGALALFFLENQIGSEKFKKAILKYLKKYKYKSVETDDFLNEIETCKNFDIIDFKNKWLMSPEFQKSVIDTLIGKSKFLQKLIKVESYAGKSFEEKKLYYLQEIKTANYYPIKEKILSDIQPISFDEKEEILYEALICDDLKVRQSVAKTLKIIPKKFQKNFETLLYDKSYFTNLEAFSVLWVNFPDKRLDYLQKIAHWYKSDNLILQINYVTYSLLNNEISQNQKNDYLQKLILYSNPTYESTIRQNALDALLTIDPKNTDGIKNLINATTHFKWQFSKYAKKKLQKIYEDDTIKIIISNLKPSLSDIEVIQINKLNN